MKKLFTYSFVALIFFGTVSLPIRKSPWFDINRISPWQLDPSKLSASLESAENDWGFVRQSAEWARGNSTFIDQIIAAIRSNAWLREPGTRTFDNVELNGRRFQVRVEIGVAQTGIESGSFPNSRSFQNKFEIRRQVEGDLALQLYFDSTEDITDNGALLYYNLARLGQTQFFAGSTTMVIETFIFRKPDGLRRQVYTWKGAPANSNTSITDVGRVVLDEVLNGKTLCFRTSVRASRSIIEQAFANSPFKDQIFSACGNNGSGDFYYSLAYMQNFDFPFLTTAKYGWSGDADRREGFCGISNANINTNNNYGIFNENGFVRDKVPANQVPSGYPSPNKGEMSVDSAFIATFTADTQLSYGVTGSDDTSKAFLDGINSNAKIAFK
ncbi:MAG: hypothetical protein JJT78_05455 [Leptospira sp.]|nr:hypothetical protein [Leptospira sp.]